MSMWDEAYPAPSSADGQKWRDRCRKAGLADPYGARQETPGEVIEEVAHILATLPGTAFYDETGHALVLAGNDYIIAVSPPEPGSGFNGGNPTTASAYLVAEPVHEAPAGWTTGWEC